MFHDFSQEKYQHVKSYIELYERKQMLEAGKEKSNLILRMKNHLGKVAKPDEFRVINNELQRTENVNDSQNKKKKVQKFLPIHVFDSLETYNIIHNLHYTDHYADHRGKDELRKTIQGVHGRSISEKVIRFVCDNCHVCRLKKKIDSSKSDSQNVSDESKILKKAVSGETKEQGLIFIQPCEVIVHGVEVYLVVLDMCIKKIFVQKVVRKSPLSFGVAICDYLVSSEISTVSIGFGEKTEMFYSKNTGQLELFKEIKKYTEKNLKITMIQSTMKEVVTVKQYFKAFFSYLTNTESPLLFSDFHCNMKAFNKNVNLGLTDDETVEDSGERNTDLLMGDSTVRVIFIFLTRGVLKQSVHLIQNIHHTITI